MAYYNPKRVDFAPNLGIIQSAGAIGNYAKDWSDGLYAKRMKREEIDYKKQQDDIRNAYEDTRLGATLDQQKAAREHQEWSRTHQKNTFDQNTLHQDRTFNQNVLHQDRTFGAQQETNKLAREQLAQEKAKEQALAIMEGQYKLQQDPSLASMLPQQQVFGTPTQTETPHPLASTGNPIIDNLLGNKNFLQPQGQSVPNIENKPVYDPNTIAMIGQSKTIKPPTEAKDPLAKERATHVELLKSGRTNLPFGDWMADGGTSNIKLKTESVTKARNKATEQTTAMDNLINQMLFQYNPSKRGVFQGTGQAIQEMIPIFHSKESAQLESAREAMIMNLATALNGGKPSNADQQIARNIIGGAWQNESGAAAKIVEVLEQGVNGLERTISQIETAGGDSTELRNKINEYKQYQEQAKQWDGSTPFGVQGNTNSKTKNGSPTVKPLFSDVAPAGITFEY